MGRRERIVYPTPADLPRKMHLPAQRATPCDGRFEAPAAMARWIDKVSGVYTSLVDKVNGDWVI